MNITENFIIKLPRTPGTPKLLSQFSEVAPSVGPTATMLTTSVHYRRLIAIQQVLSEPPQLQQAGVEAPSRHILG